MDLQGWPKTTNPISENFMRYSYSLLIRNGNDLSVFSKSISDTQNKFVRTLGSFQRAKQINMNSLVGLIKQWQRVERGWFWIRFLPDLSLHTRLNEFLNVWFHSGPKIGITNSNVSFNQGIMTGQLITICITWLIFWTSGVSTEQHVVVQNHQDRPKWDRFEWKIW